MFIISLTYIKPLSEVEKYLEAHRAYLDEAYKNNYFIASGPKVPRTGGIILAKSLDRKSLEQLIERDPFKIHEIAQYEIIEFKPKKGLPQLVEI